MWEVFENGRLPYPALSNAEVKEAVISGYRLPCPVAINGYPQIYNLMKSCWETNAELRPTFTELFDKLTEAYRTLAPEVTVVHKGIVEMNEIVYNDVVNYNVPTGNLYNNV